MPIDDYGLLRWHDCPEVLLTRAVPASFGPLLEAALGLAAAGTRAAA